MSEEASSGPTGEQLADELNRLLRSVVRWAQSITPEAGQLETQDCHWCPVCQFVEGTKGEHPQLADTVVTAGAFAVNAFRSFLDAAAVHAAERAAQQQDQAHEARPAHRGPEDGVQHIPLDGGEA